MYMSFIKIVLFIGLVLACHFSRADSASLVRETVRFERPDGDVLVATFSRFTDGRQHPTLLLLHQAGSTKEEFDFLVKEFLSLGFQTLALDLRGHGQSTAPKEKDKAFYQRLFTDPDYAPQDVKEVLSWLSARREVNPNLIGIVGGSVGANLACIAVAAGWGAKTAVALSANSEKIPLLAAKTESFSLNHVFLLAASNDFGRDTFARNLFREAHNPKKLEILKDSSAHGVSILKKEPRLKQAVIDWLKNHLKKP